MGNIKQRLRGNECDAHLPLLYTLITAHINGGEYIIEGGPIINRDLIIRGFREVILINNIFYCRGDLISHSSAYIGVYIIYIFIINLFKSSNLIEE